MPLQLAQYKLILYNDDRNSYQKVCVALMLIFKMSPFEARCHTIRAHKKGETVLRICHQELAEHYHEKLTRLGLTASIIEQKGE